MTRSGFYSLVMLGFGLLATGCATKFERQAFNSEAASGIKKITVSQWSDQDEHSVVIVNHPGLSFGLIGAAIAAGDTASKTKKLSDAMKPDSVKLSSAFYDKALPKLKDLGYEVIPVAAKRGETADAVKQRLNQAQGQDAALAIGIQASYLAAGASTHYLPSVVLGAELIDNKSQAVLYREAYHYGYNSGNKDAVHIEAATDCKFQDIDALTADIEKTRTCLTASIELLVKQLVSDLKR